MGLSAPCWAAMESYPGYTNDVHTERNEKFQEIYLSVQSADGPSLQDQIFSPLAHEFKEKYREKFGQLDTESVIYQRSQFDTFDENGGAVESIETANEQRKNFAEYMTRRLTEYHFDHYMKTQPQMRPVMEAKEKIQNVKVEVNKQVRLNIQYNFAGNNVDLIVDNPWCETKVALEMDPHSFGPTSVEETRIWLNRPLSSSLRLNTNTTINDGIAQGDLVKEFPRHNMAASVGLSGPFKDEGTSVRETKYVVGFSHSF